MSGGPGTGRLARRLRRMRCRGRRIALAAGLSLGALGVAAGGCSKESDVVVKTAGGKQLTEHDIDRDPSVLLPSGAVGLASLDAQKLFASPFGQQLLHIARTRAPIPASAGFDPARDLERILVGLYSMQGADVVAVATGNFDLDAIEAAADGTTSTPLGAPLVKQQYAGRTLYLSRNVGFVTITSRTILLGNETGMRRALDRLEEGRIERSIPKWFDDLMAEQQAPVYGGADFEANPLVGPNVDQLPFLTGARTVRMVGNFQPPGMNLAGTVSYQSPQHAEQGAGYLRQIHQLISQWGWLATFMGLGQPLQSLDVQTEGADAKVVAALEGNAVTKLLSMVSDSIGGPPPPVPATTSPAVPSTPMAPAPGGPAPGVPTSPGPSGTP